MSDIFRVPLTVLMPVVLTIYAIAFVAGGIYYLEQRVGRIRDQLPRHTMLARLTGYAALAIGVLAAVSVGGHLFLYGQEARMAALVATASGIAFCIHRLHTDLTLLQRVRDGLLALVCALLTILVYQWVSTP